MSFFIAMGIFAFTMSITPGPVNFIALSSGVNNGMVRTFPFVSGATIGFTVLLFILGLGAIELVEAFPFFMTLMGYVGVAFLFYMAYKIFTAIGRTGHQQAKVPSFFEGVLLQWLNPKAWIASISGVAAFTTAGNLNSLLLFCAIYLCICYVGVGFWAVLGAQAKQFLHSERQLSWLNKVMGSGLGLVATYLFLKQSFGQIF